MTELPPPPSAPLPASSVKPWWKRWWVIAGAIVLVFGVIGAVSGGDESEEVATVDISTTTTEAVSTTEAVLETTTTQATTTEQPTTTAMAMAPADWCTPADPQRVAVLEMGLQAPAATLGEAFELERDGLILLAANSYRENGDRHYSGDLWIFEGDMPWSVSSSAQEYSLTPARDGTPQDWEDLTRLTQECILPALRQANTGG